jgi:acyl-CoA reductase-like NAD-dependent aldehyde dehydrogenase
VRRLLIGGQLVDPGRSFSSVNPATGTVGVNGGSWFAPDAPFGGYKQSGIGREMGVAGLAEFLEVKTIAIPAA